MARKGFTLLEMIIVVVIVGIVAAFAAPTFRNGRQQAKQRDASANLKLIAAAERTYRTENNSNKFATCVCSTPDNCNAPGGCNKELHLELRPDPAGGWLYGVSLLAGGNQFTASAVKSSGDYAGCTYTLSSFGLDPSPGATCLK